MIAGAGLEGINMVDEDSEKDKPVEPPAHGTILASIELGYWGGGRIYVLVTIITLGVNIG